MSDPATPGPTGAVPREVLRQVRLIELRTRGWVDSLFSGEYQSVFKGQGIEFAEVRAYQHGDEIRAIDWNVTARTAHPHVKKHVEERELTVLLVVDLSGSEQYGSRGRMKAELAAEVAAVLALSAVRNNDRVGLLLFTDRVEHLVPPKKGKRHVLRLIRDVLVFEPERAGTDIAGALDYAGRLLRHRSIVFLLSDFQIPVGEQTRAFERGARVLARRHDVVALEIIDPGERDLPEAGLLLLEDPETGQVVPVDTGAAALRARFAGDVASRREELRRRLRRLAIDRVEIRTDASWVGPLLGFFRRRERRRG
ncbi:MAG: DUF58 domain-containing protein [Longimicrobiales bacterium]